MSLRSHVNITSFPLQQQEVVVEYPITSLLGESGQPSSSSSPADSLSLQRSVNELLAFTPDRSWTARICIYSEDGLGYI